ncbi:MAG: hypothetical protein WBP81_33885, partial [Solirubrobacteraceae bacterium]
MIEPRIAYAKSRGVNVAYAVVGDAPLDLVFVPGFVSHPEASFEFPPIERAIRRLTRFARVMLSEAQIRHGGAAGSRHQGVGYERRSNPGGLRGPERQRLAMK